jgi:hypothetical protein
MSERQRPSLPVLVLSTHPEVAAQIFRLFFEFAHNPLLLLKNPLIKSSVQKKKCVFKFDRQRKRRSLSVFCVLTCQSPLDSKHRYDDLLALDNMFLRCFANR